jgi:hypothetical protein
MAGPTNEEVGGAGILASGPARLSRDPEARGGLRLLLPGLLLERLKCADKAVDLVVAASYLLGIAARRMEMLVKQSITQLSKSQISVMAGGRMSRSL